METRVSEISNAVLAAEDQNLLTDALGMLRNPHPHQVKKGLIQYHSLLRKTEAKFNSTKEAVEDLDIYTTLIKYLLLDEKERHELLTSLTRLCHLKNSSTEKNKNIILNQITLFNKFKNTSLRVDNICAIDELPHGIKHKLLKVINEIRTPENICFPVERLLFRQVISHHESLSFKQLAMCDNLIKTVQSRIYNIEFHHSDAKSLMLRYLLMSKEERRKIIELVNNILATKDLNSTNGIHYIKKQIKKYDACMKWAVKEEDIKTSLQGKILLSDEQRQQLTLLIDKLVTIENTNLISHQVKLCDDLFEKIETEKNLRSLEEIYNSLIFYVEFINDLNSYAKNQKATIVEISTEISHRIPKKLEEFSEAYRKKLVIFKEPGNDKGSFDESLEKAKKIKTKLQETMILTICNLLKQELFLHIIETQQGLLDKDEVRGYATKYALLNINAHHTEKDLLEFVAPFYTWRKTNEHLLPGLTTSIPLLSTISSVFLALYHAGTLSQYSALSIRATRIKEILPTSNEHIKAIKHLIDVKNYIQERLTEFIQNTNSTPTRISTLAIPLLPLASVPSQDTEALSERTRKGHIRRREYQEMRGISVATPTGFFSSRNRAESTSTNTARFTPPEYNQETKGKEVAKSAPQLGIQK